MNGEYFLVPIAVVIGFFAVVLHYLLSLVRTVHKHTLTILQKVKKIGPWATTDYNLPVIIQYIGYRFHGGGTTADILVSTVAGFFNQIYMRDTPPAHLQRVHLPACVRHGWRGHAVWVHTDPGRLWCHQRGDAIPHMVG
jgi:hypothetical protein